jgi:hypothetical protein
MVAANLKNSSTPKVRKQFKDTLTIMSAQIINDTILAFEQLPNESISFDDSTGKFTTDFTPTNSFSDMVQRIVGPMGQGRNRQVHSHALEPLARMRDLLKLTEMSDYSDVIDSKQDMVRSIEEGIRQSRERSRQVAEAAAAGQ